MSRYTKDDRNYYHRPPNSGEEETQNPLIKLALFLALILVCGGIYLTIDKRKEIARELNGENLEIKQNLKDPGKINLKEKGLFGNVVEIPVLEDFKFNSYTADAVQLEFRVVYKLREDMTPEQLHEYNVDLIKSKIRQIVANTSTRTLMTNIIEDKNKFNDKLMKDVAIFLKPEKIDLFQLSFGYSEQIQEKIRQLKQAEIEKEEAKKKLEAEKIKAQAFQDAEKMRLEAIQKVKEAEEARKKMIQDAKQEVLDSIANANKIAMQIAITKQLATNVYKVPEIYISNSNINLYEAQKKAIEQLSKEATPNYILKMQIEKSIEYLKKQAEKFAS